VTRFECTTDFWEILIGMINIIAYEYRVNEYTILENQDNTSNRQYFGD